MDSSEIEIHRKAAELAAALNRDIDYMVDVMTELRTELHKANARIRFLELACRDNDVYPDKGSQDDDGD